MKIKILKITCLKCWHEWTPRNPTVRMCPKCKTLYFDKPKKEEGEITQKNCPKCKKILPIDKFRKSPKYKSGYRSWCNKCESQGSMAYYEKNRKKIIEFRRKHVIQTNKHGNHRDRIFIMGVIKRPYPIDSICEICDKAARKLSYHHWDNNIPSQGIWVCHACHSGCNFLERTTFCEKYFSTKADIVTNYNPDTKNVPLGIGRSTRGNHK